jgi:hypothetical protein
MPTISLDPVKKAADLPAECGCAKPFPGAPPIDAVSPNRRVAGHAETAFTAS